MSIADKITRLQTAKTAIADAITAKGGTVASGDGFEDFATSIGAIPSGGGMQSKSYIQLDGNCAFDTGITWDYDWNIVMCMSIDVVKATCGIFGCGRINSGTKSNANSLIIVSNQLYRYCSNLYKYGSSGNVPVANVAYYAKVKSLSGGGLWSLEDSTSHQASGGNSGTPTGSGANYTGWLGSSHYTSTTDVNGFNGKIYHAFIKDANGNLIHNYVPALNSNGIPCLYDTVTGTELEKVGSGTVTAG